MRFDSQEKPSGFTNRATSRFQIKLSRCFKALETDPRAGNNIKPLKGPFAGAYRYRIGNLRVVYTINDRAVIVFVITIAKRSDVYE